MTLTIEHKESIKGWESLLREFFTSIEITEEEKIIKTLEGLQKNLEEKNNMPFVHFQMVRLAVLSSVKTPWLL